VETILKNDAELMEEFEGVYFTQMDMKYRTPVPARLADILTKRYRKELGILDKEVKTPPVKIIICPSPSGKTGIYTEAVFNRLLYLLENPLSEGQFNVNPKSLALFIRQHKETQYLDAQNRFRVPDSFIELLDIQRDVAFLGSVDHIEMIPKATWKLGSQSTMKMLQEEDAQSMLKHPGMMPISAIASNSQTDRRGQQ